MLDTGSGAGSPNVPASVAWSGAGSLNVPASLAFVFLHRSSCDHTLLSDQSNPSSYKLHGAYSCKDRGTGPHVSTVPEDSILILNIILNIMVGSGTSGLIRSAQSLPIHTA